MSDDESPPETPVEHEVEASTTDEKDGHKSGLGERAKKWMASKTASSKLGRKVIVQLMGEYGEAVMNQLESAATKVWDKKLAAKLERNFLKVAMKSKILIDEGRLSVKDEQILSSVEPTTHLVVNLLDFLSGTATPLTAATVPKPSAAPESKGDHAHRHEHIHDHDKAHAKDSRTPIQRIQANLGTLKQNMIALLTPLQKKENVDKTALLFDHLGADKLLHALESDNSLKSERETILKNICAIIKPWKSGSSPIFLATRQGNLNVVSLLLTHGMDPNARRMNGVTPLYMAAQNNEVAIAKALIAAKASVNSQRDGGTSSLFIATQLGHSEMVELLLSSKANPNQTRENGSTALFMACISKNTEIAELLLKYGADPNHTEKDGVFPLYVACHDNLLKLAEILVDNGASVNQTGENSYFPLFLAAKAGSKPMVDFLIKHGAKVNQSEKEGATSLYIAAQNGHADVVDLLLRNGAQPNKARDDTAASPLFISTQQGHKEVVSQLLSHGAEPNQAKKNGFTAVYVAANYQHYDLLELLVAYGATFPLGPVEQVIKDGDVEKVNEAIRKGKEKPRAATSVIQSHDVDDGKIDTSPRSRAQ